MLLPIDHLSADAIELLQEALQSLLECRQIERQSIRDEAR